MLFQFGFSTHCMPWLYSHKYEKEHGQVYFYLPLNNEGRKIEKVDYRTFEVLDESGLAKDKNYVYVFGRKIKGLDTKTFEVVTVTRASLTLICDLDAKTYEIIELSGSSVTYFCYPMTAVITKDKNGEYGGALEIWVEAIQGKFEIVD